MTMRYLLILTISSFVILISGCTKEQGCTNFQACNFSHTADEDDGSCYLPGDSCDDGINSTILDQYTNICQCEGVDPSVGCLNEEACNYSAFANTDDGSCSFIGDICDDGNSATGNDTWSNSCSCEGGLLGCTISSACNYNSDAEIDDNSCAFVGDSCDDGDPNSANDVWSNSCACEGHLCGNDISHEGYDYNTVLIGYQCWFAENCRYLPSVSNSNTASSSNPYYYVYDYEGTNVAAAKATSNYETYGVIYNWPAVMTEDICPSGWHMPSTEEFTQLTDFLGGANVASGKMKEAGENHWSSPNSGATNFSGFTGLPGGYFDFAIDFSLINYFGYWWTSSESGPNSLLRGLGYQDCCEVISLTDYRKNGNSARCVRD